MAHPALVVIKFLVSLWDFFLYPLYQLWYRPWLIRRGYARVRSRVVEKSESSILFRSEEKVSERSNAIKDEDTMAKVWEWALRKYRERPILGTRELISSEEEDQGNGKVFKKLVLGEYRWITFKECDEKLKSFGRGLRRIGVCPGERIAVYADTRAEWFLTAQACFQNNFPLVTLYTNLGPDAVAYGLDQTEVQCVVCSNELFDKVLPLLPKLPKISKIIVLPDHTSSSQPLPEREGNVEIFSFKDVVASGEGYHPDFAPSAKAQDLAIIMYTSGSTGVPKGVMLTHKNLVSTLRSVTASIDFSPNSDDCFIAFLPLAHVLELLCEMMMVLYCVKIGYSNPNTLLDTSTMIKAGGKGDAALLRPTFMTGVPVVLTRIYKGISQKVESRGEFFRGLFKFCYDYRLKAIRNGSETPIMDALIFKKIRSLIGGRVKVMFSGGAPLSDEIHDYIRVCMGVKVLQGYGLTETTASATIMELDDISTGTVGAPNQFLDVKLVNWEEGNYKVTDVPRPRGEIIIGGDFVADGYYKMPEKTREDFFEESGKRWFKTGDIGEISEHGTLKIIDRKKDIVKLQLGEYVSLGKVESILKTCPVVDNVCVYGDSFKSHCVALVVPGRAVLAKLAEQKVGTYSEVEVLRDDEVLARCCDDPKMLEIVLEYLTAHCLKNKLKRFEIPGAVTLCKELWDPETGLVTAAFKIKRKPIQEFYQKDLDRMYKSSRGI